MYTLLLFFIYYLIVYFYSRRLIFRHLTENIIIHNRMFNNLCKIETKF
jgi:hypothetical protein